MGSRPDALAVIDLSMMEMNGEDMVAASKPEATEENTSFGSSYAFPPTGAVDDDIVITVVGEVADLMFDNSFTFGDRVESCASLGSPT